MSTYLSVSDFRENDLPPKGGCPSSANSSTEFEGINLTDVTTRITTYGSEACVILSRCSVHTEDDGENAVDHWGL